MKIKGKFSFFMTQFLKVQRLSSFYYFYLMKLLYLQLQFYWFYYLSVFVRVKDHGQEAEEGTEAVVTNNVI